MKSLEIPVGESGRKVGALLRHDEAFTSLYVMAHGAGAGMRHPFMEAISAALAERKVGTLRFDFPYMQEGRRRPDPPGLSQATVRAAVRQAAEIIDPGRIFAGGKSFGGRMTAYAAAGDSFPACRGLAFLGFPLHPPGREGTGRWQPMTGLRLPALFLQGTRDKLADLDLLTPLVGALQPAATLHIVEGADHSFHVLKRSGRNNQEVIEELADAVQSFVGAHSPAAAPTP